ncbi:hypothetical protein TNCV_4589201 [Trichonephila clavipes]|nr:hypothetical protein TNCV_4589201 [Trichonephila clavipes]
MRRSPRVLHTNTIVITVEIESEFVAENDLVPFRCGIVSLVARHHSKRRRRWMGVKGAHLHTGRHDPKCPSARRLRTVREDTRAPVKVPPVLAWRPMKQLAVGVHFLRCGGLLDDWSVKGVLEPGLRVNNISRIHWF